jgi:hypothetical protein
MYFWCLSLQIYTSFFYLVMSLTNYENGVAMVKRLGTTGLNNDKKSLFPYGIRLTILNQATCFLILNHLFVLISE